MKPPPVVSINPQVKTTMKELVDIYRPVRQRKERSETPRGDSPIKIMGATVVPLGLKFVDWYRLGC